MGSVVLTLWPPLVPVTSTETVQLADPARVAPLRLTEPEPATAVTVPAVHVLLTLFGVATTRPAGKLSVKPTAVSPAGSVAVIVKTRPVVPCTGTDAAPNSFVNVGAVPPAKAAGAVATRLTAAVSARAARPRRRAWARARVLSRRSRT